MTLGLGGSVAELQVVKVSRTVIPEKKNKNLEAERFGVYVWSRCRCSIRLHAVERIRMAVPLKSVVLF